MKKFLFGLAAAIFAATGLFAQPTPVMPREATVAEMAAGTSGTVFVSPRRLSGGGGPGIFTMVEVGDGTVSAPSYSFSSEITTGWYRSNTAEISLALGGVQAASFARVSGSGGLKITGAGSGAGALQFIAGGTAQDITLTPSTTGSVKIIGASETSWFGALTGAPTYGAITFAQATPSVTNFSIAGNGTSIALNAPTGGVIQFDINGALKASMSATVFQLESTNTVKFGTTALASIGVSTDTTAGALQIQAPSAGSVAFTSSRDTTFAGAIVLNTTNQVQFGSTASAFIGVSANTTAGDLTFTSTSTGNFVFSGGKLLAPDGNASTPGHSFSSDPDTGMYKSNTNELSFATGGGQALKLDASQNATFTGGFLTVASTSDFNWSGRSGIRSPSDGVLTLLNNAESGFTRLNFGGTTSSFPAITRNGTRLEVKLADDSAAAAFKALQFVGETNTLSGAGAVSATTSVTLYTSTGVAQALTLADGNVGQYKTVVHDVDGGSGVLTPTTKSGFSTVTFTNAGDTVTLLFTSGRGWVVVGSYGVVVAP